MLGLHIAATAASDVRAATANMADVKHDLLRMLELIIEQNARKRLGPAEMYLTVPGDVSPEELDRIKTAWSRRPATITRMQ